MKIFAVLLAIGGVAMVSFGSSKESDNDVETTWFGYIECLISTLIYAIQGVATKYYGNRYFRHELGLELADDFLFMVGMAIFVFLTFWPGLIILNAIGIEMFVFPTTYQDIMTVILPVLLDGIFIGSYMAGITLSGPILISVGSLAVIPVSFIVDVWLHGLQVTVLAVCGSFLIFLSFIIMEMPIKKIMPCIGNNQ